jgi:hypothetical protein
MTQGVLPFQYEDDDREVGMTGVAGLGIYLDFWRTAGLGRLIEQCLRVHGPSQGWTDEQIVKSLVLLNIAGGDCVDDLSMLESDTGLCQLIRQTEEHGRTRSERRSLRRRWRRKRSRTFPSATAVLDYLRCFHDKIQERLREIGKAFIPAPTEALLGLISVNAGFVAWVQRHSPKDTATLDMDATLIETYKKLCLYCYKKFKAYQPLNIYWAEQGLVLYSELRDGNVPANYELLGPFEQALEVLPLGVKKVFLRSDTAGNVEKLLRYCAEAKNKRFNLIEFAIGVDVTQEFKKAVAEIPESEWFRLNRKVNGELEWTNQEYAEVCFVPNWVGQSKNGPVYRYVAVREPLGENKRPKKTQKTTKSELPFPTMDMQRVKYKVTGLVTNRDLPGDDLIWWYRERCGKSEEAHSIMKQDLAGGQFPSALFGANAAWWQIMILSLNFQTAIQRLVLGGRWVSRRLKSIRFRLINVPGTVFDRSRGLVVRLVGGHPSYEIFLEARRRMLSLCGSG